MRDEIARILELAKAGTLTSAQAAEMIAALKDTAAPEAETPEAEAAAGRGFDSRHRGHRRHRHRHSRHREAGEHDHGADHVGEELQRAMGAGARTLRWALKSGLGWSSAWSGASSTNDSVLSKVQAPTGRDYVCENNHFAVAHLRDLKLMRSTFSDNDVDAAHLDDIELTDSQFTHQRVRGSSVANLVIEHGTIHDNELNGGRLARLAVDHGRLESCLINGSQLKDLGISSSVMSECRLNGVTLKTVVMNSDSHVKGLSLNGVMGRNWMLEGAVIADTSISGMRVDGLALRNSGLDNVRFSISEYAPRLDRRAFGLMRDVEFKRVVLKHCTFEDCSFDGTRFEGFDAANLTFKGVDFRGLVISSAEELQRLAGERRVA